jgi:hypothetical protein
MSLFLVGLLINYQLVNYQTEKALKAAIEL